MNSNKNTMRVFIGDTESDGLLDDATRLWCGVFKNIDTNEVFQFYEGDGNANFIRSMLDWLDANVDVLIMHNGVGHDWPLLRKLYGYEFKGKKVDTLLISRVQRPERPIPKDCPNRMAPHSVEAWGYRFGRQKPEHEDWSRFSPEMLHRCTEDVHIQHMIYKALLEEGKGEGWRNCHILNVRLFEILQLSEEYGWYADVNHICEAIHTLNKWISKIDRAVSPRLPLITEPLELKVKGEYNYVKKPFKKDGSYSEICLRFLANINDPNLDVGGPFSRVSFRPVDLNSNQEVKAYLLSQGWQPKEWNKNDAGERTSPVLDQHDPFEGITKGVGKLVAKRVQCRHRRSSLIGLLDLIREDGRIASIVKGFTTTYRAKHAGIVNIPRITSFFGKSMRKCFVARPGWVLVGTDSDANHARQLAARMGNEEFIFAVTQGKKEDGTDMHSVNKRKIGPICKTRDASKIFFYAFLLGAMPKKLSLVLESSVEEAGEARENFLNNMPGLKDVIDKLTTEWRSHATMRYNRRWNRMEYRGGWFKGLDGRPVFCEYEKDLLGYALQSDESIQMAKAYITFYEWMLEAGYKWREDFGIVCWYHDEFTVECRPEIAHEVGKLAAKAIEWAGEFYNIKCPHKGNYQIGKSWADIH